MNNLFIIALFLFSSLLFAKPNIEIYYEPTENGWNIYADNHEYCPVSISLEFTLTNMRSDESKNKVYVVNALQKKQLLTTLNVINKNKEYKFSYKSWNNYGDHTKQDFDINYGYDLPYLNSNAFNIYQGYNGTSSHVNENALDFSMPLGTEISAVREGIVIRVIDHNNKNCGTRECAEFNNLILIYHPDGTFAEYAHIQQNGAKVKVGDKINKGQILAYSGNVGWSTGPHLHLVIFQQKLMNRKTLRTQFKTGNGEKLEYLREKQTYSRNY